MGPWLIVGAGLMKAQMGGLLQALGRGRCWERETGSGYGRWCTHTELLQWAQGAPANRVNPFGVEGAHRLQSTLGSMCSAECQPSARAWTLGHWIQCQLVFLAFGISCEGRVTGHDWGQGL